VLADDYVTVLVAQALEVMKKAYAPYSNFPVGAAVAHKHNIAVGCNVENAAYGSTICAERVAVCAGVAAGWLGKDSKITALVVVTARQDFVKPCGACLQFIAEFADDQTIIISVDRFGRRTRQYKFSELLPRAFSLTYKQINN
jgi:cytidine deaminase